MTHTKRPTFYVRPPQEIIDWAASDAGKKAIREAEKSAERALRELDKERELTREMLQRPITL
ncbi:MAG: hypothetical protein LBF93_10870 [Zoogloeaceae bacterium]|jgi:hypothetical protein|nr:hypothetical protein [Zoogloeaceae bacterium]